MGVDGMDELIQKADNKKKKKTRTQLSQIGIDGDGASGIISVQKQQK